MTFVAYPGIGLGDLDSEVMALAVFDVDKIGGKSLNSSRVCTCSTWNNSKCTCPGLLFV